MCVCVCRAPKRYSFSFLIKQNAKQSLEIFHYAAVQILADVHTYIHMCAMYVTDFQLGTDDDNADDDYNFCVAIQ